MHIINTTEDLISSKNAIGYSLASCSVTGEPDFEIVDLRRLRNDVRQGLHLGPLYILTGKHSLRAVIRMVAVRHAEWRSESKSGRALSSTPGYIAPTHADWRDGAKASLALMKHRKAD